MQIAELTVYQPSQLITGPDVLTKHCFTSHYANFCQSRTKIKTGD